MSKMPINRDDRKPNSTSSLKEYFIDLDLDKDNRGTYLILIGGIIFLMAFIGNLAGEAIRTDPIDYENDFVADHFKIHTKVENFNNKQNGLIRETDFLHFVTTVTNTHSETTKFNYQAMLNWAGYPKNLANETIYLEPNEEKTFSTIIPLEKAGINLVTLYFEMSEDRRNLIGILTTGTDEIEKKDLQFYYRALTQSDYDFQIERSLLYQFLWISASPFVILGIKALRDIIQVKNIH